MQRKKSFETNNQPITEKNTPQKKIPVNNPEKLKSEKTYTPKIKHTNNIQKSEETKGLDKEILNKKNQLNNQKYITKTNEAELNRYKNKVPLSKQTEGALKKHEKPLTDSKILEEKYQIELTALEKKLADSITTTTTTTASEHQDEDSDSTDNDNGDNGDNGGNGGNGGNDSNGGNGGDGSGSNGGNGSNGDNGDNGSNDHTGTPHEDGGKNECQADTSSEAELNPWGYSHILLNFPNEIQNQFKAALPPIEFHLQDEFAAANAAYGIENFPEMIIGSRIEIANSDPMGIFA